MKIEIKRYKILYLFNHFLLEQKRFGTINRSSRPEVFCEKGVLRNFAKFTGKYLCQSLFFNKVAGLRSATLFKKRLRHRCFPVNAAKFLRTPFLVAASVPRFLEWKLEHSKRENFRLIKLCLQKYVKNFLLGDKNFIQKIYVHEAF